MDRDLRRHTFAYLAGDCGISEFQERVLAVTWAPEHSQQVRDSALAAEIELALAEYANHDWTETELRSLLADALRAYEIGSPELALTSTSVR